MSYLADVKSQLKGVFDEAFDYAWKDVIEPALKQSYKNGVEAGRAEQGAPPAETSKPARRRWGNRATTRATKDGESDD